MDIGDLVVQIECTTAGTATLVLNRHSVCGRKLISVGYMALQGDLLTEWDEWRAANGVEQEPGLIFATDGEALLERSAVVLDTTTKQTAFKMRWWHEVTFCR